MNCSCSLSSCVCSAGAGIGVKGAGPVSGVRGKVGTEVVAGPHVDPRGLNDVGLPWGSPTGGPCCTSGPDGVTEGGSKVLNSRADGFYLLRPGKSVCIWTVESHTDSPIQCIQYTRIHAPLGAGSSRGYK